MNEQRCIVQFVTYLFDRIDNLRLNSAYTLSWGYVHTMSDSFGAATKSYSIGLLFKIVGHSFFLFYAW